MDADVPPVSDPATGPVRYTLWVAWICVRLALAYYLGHPDVFFYQGF
jgi:hypothetical protein